MPPLVSTSGGLQEALSEVAPLDLQLNPSGPPVGATLSNSKKLIFRQALSISSIPLSSKNANKVSVHKCHQFDLNHLTYIGKGTLQLSHFAFWCENLRSPLPVDNSAMRIYSRVQRQKFKTKLEKATSPLKFFRCGRSSLILRKLMDWIRIITTQLKYHKSTLCWWNYVNAERSFDGFWLKSA